MATEKGQSYDFGVNVNGQGVKDLRAIRKEANATEKALESLDKKSNVLGGKQSGQQRAETASEHRARTSKSTESTLFTDLAEQEASLRRRKGITYRKPGGGTFGGRGGGGGGSGGGPPMIPPGPPGGAAAAKGHKDHLKHLEHLTHGYSLGKEQLIKFAGKLGVIGIAVAAVVGVFATMYHAVKKVAHAFAHLIKEGIELERVSRQLTPMFGSQTNMLNALGHANKMAAEGMSAFEGMDVVKGFAKMQNVGLDAKKNFQLAADMAGYAGTSFEEASGAIEEGVKGNFAAFEKFGIQEIYLRHLKALRANTPAMRGAIIGFLKDQKMFTGEAKKALNTWDGIMVGIRAVKTEFMEAIIGRPDDEYSLYGKVKETFGKVRDFLTQHSHTIHGIGKGISQVLKWVWRQIDIVATKVMGALNASIESSGGFFHHFEENMMSFVLWLELTKIKVVNFYRKWADEIKLIGNILATPFRVLTGVLKTAWELMKNFYGSFVDIYDLVTGKKSFSDFGESLGVRGKKVAMTVADAAVTTAAPIADYVNKKISGRDYHTQDNWNLFKKDNEDALLTKQEKIERDAKKASLEKWMAKEGVKGSTSTNGGEVTINVTGTTDPEVVAHQVVKVMKEKQTEQASRSGKDVRAKHNTRNRW